MFKSLNYLSLITGEHETPGVYVNVAQFRKWIDEQMKLNQIPISGYNL